MQQHRYQANHAHWQKQAFWILGVPSLLAQTVRINSVGLDEFHPLYAPSLFEDCLPWLCRKPLPDNGVFVDEAGVVAGEAALRVQVSERGTARAMLISGSEVVAREVQRLPRYVRATRFRPALDGGEVRAAQLDNWRAVAFE